MERTPAATRVLEAAVPLVQERGYNGFSYADVAARVGVTKATLHHHFPTKDALGVAVAERYRQAFAERLDDIEQSSQTPRERLERYAELYIAAVANGSRMCLCGLLAAESSTLPAPVRQEVQRFFVEQRRWLVRTLAAGSVRDVDGCADLLLAGLEGASLIARIDGGSKRLRATANDLIAAVL